MTSVTAHREAEKLMSEAERLHRHGMCSSARLFYQHAADCEVDAFCTVPTSRRRTRGILAVSAVSLYQRAHAWEQGIQAAKAFLAGADLPRFHRQQLQILLMEMELQASAAAEESGTA